MEQKKRCNINAYKCKKYSMSLIYVVFCFERLKHVQNFNLNYSRTEEFVYIQNW